MDIVANQIMDTQEESQAHEYENTFHREGENVTIMNHTLLWFNTMMMTIKRMTFKHINLFLKVNSGDQQAVSLNRTGPKSSLS